ncbi:hypothetical protein AKO1_003614 [Acrasis kona]|uniref:F-box domain-containing protein n=1 Tax=Acrasis kona TaxID=1008807 RepID=A0AAW2Z6E1_9EUKA
MRITDLPREVLAVILEYLSIQCIAKVSEVSIKLMIASKSDMLWNESNKSLPFQGSFKKYLSYLSELEYMQMFAIHTATEGKVAIFDPFTKLSVTTTTLTESLQDFRNLTSFLGIANNEHDGSEQFSQSTGMIFKEGLFVDDHDFLDDFYLLFQQDESGKSTSYPVSCYNSQVGVWIQFIKPGQTQTEIEREMASQAAAKLTSERGNNIRFVSWEKARLMCTRKYRLVKSTNLTCKNYNYWFG